MSNKRFHLVHTDYQRAMWRHRKGFTLIEALVAVGILITTLSGIIALTVMSLRVLNVEKNRLLATEIASEGIEFIINKRDNNVQCIQSPTCTLDCADWRDGLLATPGNGCSFLPRSWEVDAAKSEELLPNTYFGAYDNTDHVCIENIGTHKGKFVYCGNNPAKMLLQSFTREVKVSDLAADKVRVESIVTWEFFGTHTIKLEEILYGSSS